MGKLIFIDIDGTLIDYENRIPESAAKAIRLARENGHKIFICTGRTKSEIFKEILDLGFDGIISNNGAYIEAGGKEVFNKKLTLEQTKAFTEWLKKKNIEFYTENSEKLFASENFRETIEPYVNQYWWRIGYQENENLTVPTVFENMVFNEDPVKEDIYKIYFLFSSYDDLLQLKSAFPDLFVVSWFSLGGRLISGEAGAPNIDKGDAVKILVDYLGADMKDTIGFGDSWLDTPMIKACQIGVAMGNSEHEVLQAADLITDDVDFDGLYKAFKKLGLLQKKK